MGGYPRSVTAHGQLFRLRMPPLPFFPTFLQLNDEDWFDRAAISRIFRVCHASGGFAEANQLFISHRLNAFSEIIHVPRRDSNHWSLPFHFRFTFFARHFSQRVCVALPMNSLPHIHSFRVKTSP